LALFHLVKDNRWRANSFDCCPQAAGSWGCFAIGQRNWMAVNQNVSPFGSYRPQKHRLGYRL